MIKFICECHGPNYKLLQFEVWAKTRSDAEGKCYAMHGYRAFNVEEAIR